MVVREIKGKGLVATSGGFPRIFAKDSLVIYIMKATLKVKEEFTNFHDLDVKLDWRIYLSCLIQ